MSHRCVARSVIYLIFLSDIAGFWSIVAMAFDTHSYDCAVAMRWICVNSIALFRAKITVLTYLQPADNLFNISMFLDMWHTLSFSISSDVGTASWRGM